jgi:hypothetical protein
LELSESLQLRVFGFGRNQERNIRVGIFPERKKILMCRFGLAVSP